MEAIFLMCMLGIWCIGGFCIIAISIAAVIDMITDGALIIKIKEIINEFKFSSK